MDKILLRYVNPRGPLPEVKGQGTLLIMGSACQVWDDLRRYDKAHGPQDRMAVNDMMMHYPERLDHGASLHADKMPGWGFFQAYLASRRPCKPMVTHAAIAGKWVKYAWPLHRDGGTSGLFGVLIGLLMGYDRIVLAGIPCDGSPRIFDPPWLRHPQFSKKAVHDEWKRARDEIFQGRVTSLSGNTAVWLGEPRFAESSEEEDIPEKRHAYDIQLAPVKDNYITVITPTGDRPEALHLLRHWMAKQNLKPDQWIIVDDGKVPVGKIHEATVIRREPTPDDSPVTIGENLQAAFPKVRNNKILIMEDDDWYSPLYIETMARYLDHHDLVGLWGTKYWHVEVPGYRNMGQEGHASLSQTGFKKSIIPQVVKAIPGNCSVDLRLWWGGERRQKNNQIGQLFPGADKKLHCGIKGLPGRAGAGVGHDPQHYTADPDYLKLQEWCDDWEVYCAPFIGLPRLAIYTAIAGNHGRDTLLEPETAIPAVDYVCFTDQELTSNVWDIRPFSWKGRTPAMTAKHPKVLPHRHFSSYELSVWIDGNIRPNCGVLDSVEQVLAEHHLAVHKHPSRGCLYREAEHIVTKERAEPELTEKMVWRYLKEKMPHNFGLWEGGIMYRRHHDPAVVEAMELWWKEIKAGTDRDQVPLAYVLWKTALPVNTLPENLRETPYFTLVPHTETRWGESCL